MALFTTTWLLFFALLLLAKKRGANRITADDGSLVCSPFLLWLHLAGIILFGLLPFCSSALTKPVLFTAKSWQGLPTLFSLLFFGLALWLSSRLANSQTRLPSRDERAPEISYLAAYFLLRMLFIIAYEIWFRGFLLQRSMQVFGLINAMGLNLVLYTLLHVVNNKKEMLLCIPFGILLCSLCIWQDAVWPAVLIHLALTTGYEFILVRKQFTKTFLYEHPRHRRIGLYRS